jgi:hypothetical protein
MPSSPRVIAALSAAMVAWRWVASGAAAPVDAGTARATQLAAMQATTTILP